MIRRLALAPLIALAACAAPPAGPAPIEYRGGDAGAPSAASRLPPLIQLEPEAAAPAAGYGGCDDAIVVPAGATLYQVSEACRVSLRGLIDANDLSAPFLLAAGQTLKLPPRNTYVVQPGDTLYAIARRHRVQPRSLALLNNMREPYAIAPGDVIELPGAARDWETATHSAASAGEAAPSRVSIVTDAPGAPAARAGGAAANRPRAVEPTGPAPTFTWPVDGEVVDGFGPKAAGRRNDGLNIAVADGAPVRAAADGIVVYAGDELAGYGNLVLIKHPDGWVSAYAHNRALLVTPDAEVTQGQTIAEAGSTGSVESPQLHFELRRTGRPIDPASVLPG